MSFKFKIGAIIHKVGEPEIGLFRVIGLLLNDQVNVRSLNGHRSQIVESKDYERFKKEAIKPHNQDNDKATRRRAEKLSEY